MHLGALCPRRPLSRYPVITLVPLSLLHCRGVSRTPGEPCHDVHSKALQHVAGHSWWRLGWEDEARDWDGGPTCRGRVPDTVRSGIAQGRLCHPPALQPVGTALAPTLWESRCACSSPGKVELVAAGRGGQPQPLQTLTANKQGTRLQALWVQVRVSSKHNRFSLLEHPVYSSPCRDRSLCCSGRLVLRDSLDVTLEGTEATLYKDRPSLRSWCSNAPFLASLRRRHPRGRPTS